MWKVSLRIFQSPLFPHFSSKIFLWQVGNALLIIRYISTFFAVRLSPQEFIKVLESPKTADSGDGMLFYDSFQS